MALLHSCTMARYCNNIWWLVHQYKTCNSNNNSNLFLEFVTTLVSYFTFICHDIVILPVQLPNILLFCFVSHYCNFIILFHTIWYYNTYSCSSQSLKLYDVYTEWNVQILNCILTHIVQICNFMSITKVKLNLEFMLFYGCSFPSIEVISNIMVSWYLHI